MRAKATAPGIMPGQSPAGRSGAAAPRDQPAPPPNGDGAPPPAKQGSAGAEGAEIARPTDSASEGPRPSDSLEEAALQPEVDSLARGKSVCPKPKQFVLGGRGALGLIPDASWEGGKATVQRKM